MFLKSLRVLAPWEKGDVDQICQSDFSRGGQIKRDVSVYDVELPDLVRTHAEHQASAPMYLQSGKWLDVTGILHNIHRAPSGQPFAFIRDAHCNADLPDDQAVKTFIRNLLADFANRVHRVEQKDVKAYVRKMKATGDPEWAAFFKSGPIGASWQKL